MTDKLVKLPDGCWVLAEQECELCDKVTSTLKLEWHTVHNHPFYFACPACRETMETWKPLPGPRKDDGPDAVSVKIDQPKRKLSLPEMHRRRMVQEAKEEKEPEPFTFEMDTSVSLDDLMEDTE